MREGQSRISLTLIRATGYGLSGDWNVGVAPVLQRDGIHEHVALDGDALKNVLGCYATPLHGDATDFNASAKRSNPSKPFMRGGKILGRRLLELRAGKCARRELGRQAVQQQHEVGGDVLLLELFDRIGRHPQAVAETASVPSGEV